MKLPTRKLDFLLIYVVVSISAIGILRSIITRIAEWMLEFPAAITIPGEF
jgi:hypothetical protein